MMPEASLRRSSRFVTHSYFLQSGLAAPVLSDPSIITIYQTPQSVQRVIKSYHASHHRSPVSSNLLITSLRTSQSLGIITSKIHSLTKLPFSITRHKQAAPHFSPPSHLHWWSKATLSASLSPSRLSLQSPWPSFASRLAPRCHHCCPR